MCLVFKLQPNIKLDFSFLLKNYLSSNWNHNQQINFHFEVKSWCGWVHSREIKISMGKKILFANICHQIRIKLITIIRWRCWEVEHAFRDSYHNQFYSLDVESHKIHAINMRAISLWCVFCVCMSIEREKKVILANYLPMKHNQSSPSVSILTDTFNYRKIYWCHSSFFLLSFILATFADCTFSSFSFLSEKN